RPHRLAFFPSLGTVFVSVFLAAAGVELRAATITAASVSLVDVSAAVASAVDGDTVIVPSGTATWTSRLVIANAITLIGQTTTDAVAGTAVDNTIIVSKLVAPNLTPLLALDTSSGKTYRVSGITFKDAQTVPTGQYHTSITGQSNSVRLDHCHYVLTNNWLSC